MAGEFLYEFSLARRFLSPLILFSPRLRQTGLDGSSIWGTGPGERTLGSIGSIEIISSHEGSLVGGFAGMEMRRLCFIGWRGGGNTSGLDPM